MIYLDHAATTPLSDYAFDAMRPYLQENFGNAGSMHHLGVNSKRALRMAREKIANRLKVNEEEIIFTSGGTESNNLAIHSAIQSATPKNGCKGHIITSAMEHHSVYHVMEQLEKEGYEITWLVPRVIDGADEEGVISAKQVEEAIRPNTILISLMMVNNEIGTISQIETIGQIAKARGILFHTDAVAAVGQLWVEPNRLKVDFLSASAHKFGGMKGCGFLYVRKGIEIAPLLYGGGQEYGKRPGTEFVPGIVAMAAALDEAMTGLEQKQRRIAAMRNRLAQGLLEIGGVRMNGTMTEGKRTAGNLNVTFDRVQSETLLMMLNMRQICVSAGSACTSGSKTSHVLESLGYQEELAHGTIRFSLGIQNTEAEIEETIKTVKELVSQLRILRD